MGKAFQMMEQHGIGDVSGKYQAWGRAIAECALSRRKQVWERLVRPGAESMQR